MAWRIAKPFDQPEIQELLSRYELYAASLTRRLINRQRSQIVFPATRNALLFVNDGYAGISELIYLDRSGYVFPLFSDFSSPAGGGSADYRELAAMIPRRNWYSVMGKKAHVDMFLKITVSRTVHRVEYQVMSRSPSSVGLQIEYGDRHSALTITTAGRDDGDRLLDLAVGYEIEEVLIPGRHPDPGFIRKRLRENLLNERVIYASEKGRPVAKAQTNARGLRVEQIGGVYTLPSHRNQGISSILIENLSRQILAGGKIPSLYVKTTNKAAARVYQKCGFESGPLLSIGYFS